MPLTVLDEALDYAWFAERYRWPPSVVDEQPVWVVENLPYLASAFDEARDRLSERAQQEAERRAAR